jgi:hypothetical protein
MYHYAERLGAQSNDNLINYTVGPVRLRLDTYSETITLEVGPLWVEDLENCKIAVQCAFEIEDSRVTYITNTKIEIKANYKITRKYLLYVLMYITPSDEQKKELINAFKERINDINNHVNLSDYT